MKAPCEAILLRIFIGYDDTYGEKSLYDEVVLKAYAMHMAGATVTRGVLAYGPASHDPAHVLARLSEDLPIVIDIIDSEDKIKEFAAAIDPMIRGGLITMQKVSVLRYGPSAKALPVAIASADSMCPTA